MREFHEYRKLVIEQLMHGGCSAGWIAAHDAVYGALELWLQIENRDCDSRSFHTWLESDEPCKLLSVSARNAAKSAVKHLDAVSETGRIPELPISAVLSESFREVLDEYCSRAEFSSVHLVTTRKRCELFLRSMEEYGAQIPDEITYPFVLHM